MQVKLEKTIEIAAPAAAAWKVIQDVDNVAACMPGAEITARIDGTHYQGRVKVKVGPVVANFKGQLEILSMDAEKMALKVRGKGSEEKGASAASLELSAWVKPLSPDRCEVGGVQELTLTGKLASFGARMMTQMAEQIADRFAANLSNHVLAAAGGAHAEAAAAEIRQQPREFNVLAALVRSLWNLIKSLFGTRSKQV